MVERIGELLRCAYPLNNELPLEFCGAPGKPGSPYCAVHHAFCYLPRGSRRERDAVDRIERLAALAARDREADEQPAEFVSAIDPATAALAPAAPPAPPAFACGRL
jgi:hypothetical protein